LSSDLLSDIDKRNPKLYACGDPSAALESMRELTFPPPRGLSNYMSAGNFTESGCVSLIRWLGGIETPRLNVYPGAPTLLPGGVGA